MMGNASLMNLTEALAKTATVNIGVEARCVRRRDRRGRTWYLIGACDKLLLVRQDKSGFVGVSHKFAAQWEDWRPQSTEDVAREVAILDTPGGRRVRNTILGMVLGPVPEGLQAPDCLPVDF
jgi:hypothetical protein